jgi:hypothetical protein
MKKRRWIIIPIIILAFIASWCSQQPVERQALPTQATTINGTISQVVGPGYYNGFTVANGKTIECIPARSCIVNNTIKLNGNATLKGFVVDGAYSYAGIELYVGNNLAENNEVRNVTQCSTGHAPGDGTCPSYADADGFRFWGPGNIMRGNYIHDITYANPLNQHPTTPPHIDCFQTWSDSSTHIPAVSTIIEYNICDNFSELSTYKGGTMGVELDDASGTIIQNNYFHTFGKKVDLDTNNSNTTIKNNIFIGGPINLSKPQYGIFNSGGTNTIVNNNLFYDINGGTTPWIFNVPAANQWANLMKINPQLSSTYRPLPGSPLCGAGTNGSDIGVYPCGGPVPPTATNTPVPATQTSTATRTAIPPSFTPIPPTATIKIPQTFTSVVILSPTFTLIPPSVTNTAIIFTPTNTKVPVTPTATPTPPPAYDRCDYNKDGRISGWSEWICKIFGR